ncbi:hypothetical protein Ancab_026232 [Ancistrocladus abbreviatus]
MEREAAPPALSPAQLLHLAETHLRVGNFSLCREYALETLQSDGPLYKNNHRYASQITAVAEVLSAASEILGTTNWYSVLQVDTFCNDLTLIRSQFKNLMLLLDPMKHKSQFANHALNLLWKAWGVLSNPSEKSEFDSELNLVLAKKRLSDDNVAQNATFWTFCPYCYYMYEYARRYEACCLRCQNGECRRAFHGVSISIPYLPSMAIGHHDCCSCFGYFPMGYSGSDKGKGAGKFDSWSPIVAMYPVGGMGTNGVGGLGNGLDGNDNFAGISDESDEMESPGNGNSEEGTHFDEDSQDDDGDEDEESGIPSAPGVGSGSRGGCKNDNVEFFEQDGELFVGLLPDSAC